MPGTHQLLVIMHNLKMPNTILLLKTKKICSILAFLVFSVTSGSLHEEKPVFCAKTSIITNVTLLKKIKKNPSNISSWIFQPLGHLSSFSLLDFALVNIPTGVSFFSGIF